jgi:RimJ/RimL family protein N-acetyltransferase
LEGIDEQHNNIKIIEFEPVYAEETVRMWRQSKERANSKGRLTLFTFEVNHKAQRFYEKNGFKIIGRAYENEEGLKMM